MNHPWIILKSCTSQCYWCYILISLRFWSSLWDASMDFFDAHSSILNCRYFQGIPEAVSESEPRGGCACWSGISNNLTDPMFLVVTSFFVLLVILSIFFFSFFLVLYTLLTKFLQVHAWHWNCHVEKSSLVLVRMDFKNPEL